MDGVKYMEQGAGVFRYSLGLRGIIDSSMDVQHVLHRLLPPPSVASQHYELRRRAHSRELPARSLLADSLTLTLLIEFYLRTSTDVY